MHALEGSHVGGILHQCGVFSRRGNACGKAPASAAEGLVQTEATDIKNRQRGHGGTDRAHIVMRGGEFLEHILHEPREPGHAFLRFGHAP